MLAEPVHQVFTDRFGGVKACEHPPRVSGTLDRELAARQRVIPTVLCGDFNSEPTSAVYQLVHEGLTEGGSVERIERLKDSEEGM